MSNLAGRRGLPTDGAPPQAVELPPPDRTVGRVIAVPLYPALWIAVLAAGLALRLGSLDLLPLAPDEAARALAGRAIWRSSPLPYAEGPLLPNLLAISFGLFSASDGPARLPSALAGWLLCLSPLLFRPWLSPAGRLGGAALLTFSPFAVLASRSVHPAAFVMLALAVILGCVLRAYSAGDGRWLLGATGAAAVGLAAGGAFVGHLMAIALAAAIVPPLARIDAPSLRVWGPRAVAVALSVALLVDTLLLTRPAGLQAGLIDPFPAWLAMIGLSGTAAFGAALAGAHEVALLAAAVWLAPVALGDRFGRFLLAWSLAAMGLNLLGRTADLAVLGGALVPLSLLVGFGVRRFTWLARARAPRVWLTGLALVVPFVALAVAINASAERGAVPGFGPFVVAAGCMVAVLLLASAWLDVPDLTAAVGVCVLLGLLPLGSSFLTRLNYSAPERGGPVLFGQSSRPELREVEAIARDWWRQDPRAPIFVERSLRPVLEWSLRNGPPIQWIITPPPSAERAILGADTAENRPVGAWMRLTAAERYTPPDNGPGLPALWRWLIARRTLVKAEPHAILVQP